MFIKSTYSLLIISVIVCGVHSHGFLWNPPARSSAYFAGYNITADYNHMGLNCGGFDTQWDTYNGLCGVCGDNYGDSTPRDHEVGGRYALADRTVTGSYVSGGILTVGVNITAYHKGFFTFRLCANNDFSTEVTQDCLDDHVLAVHGTTGTQYDINGGTTGHYQLDLQLPAGVECDQCVLQWNYTTGNSWNMWPGENGCVGCGPQETFINCADIEILGNSQSSSTSASTSTSTSTTQSSTMSVISGSTSTQSPTTSTPSPTTSIPSPTTSTPYSASTTSTTSSVPPTSSTTTLPSSTSPTTVPTSTTSSTGTTTTTTTTTQATTTSTSTPSSTSAQPCTNSCTNVSDICDCVVTTTYQSSPGMKNWCKINCRVGYCPPTHCVVCYCH